jgi:hypothetical protein
MTKYSIEDVFIIVDVSKPICARNIPAIVLARAGCAGGRPKRKLSRPSEVKKAIGLHNFRQPQIHSVSTRWWSAVLI